MAALLSHHDVQPKTTRVHMTQPYKATPAAAAVTAAPLWLQAVPAAQH
jgi:hypothetical protein